MQRVMNILNASILCRWLFALADQLGVQWNSSRVVQWFLNPSRRAQGASEHSVFTCIWNGVRGGLCRLYEKLRLEKLLGDSVFTRLWFWCMLPVVFAALLPTMVVAALGGVAVCSLALALLRDRQRKLIFSPINKYVLLYAAVYAVGTVASVTPRASLPVGLLTVFFTLFTLLPLNSVGSRSQLERMVRLVVLGGVLVALYGILQYIFRFGYQSDAWVDSSMFGGISFRVVSTLENPNMLGQYLVLMIPLGGACLLNAAEKKERWFWLGCCGVLCACMLLTFSRGGWLALLVAALVFAVLINPRLLMLAPFALLVLYFVLPDTIIQRFTSIGNLSDHSTSYRVSIWLGSLRMLADYWLCGIGPGNAAFNTVYPAYSYDEIVTPHSHNLLLQITADAGICAVVLFCVILFCYFRWLCAALHREQKTGKGRMYHIAFISGVAGFMVQAMTDFSFYNYRVMFVFWVYLALGMAAARWRELPEEVEG